MAPGVRPGRRSDPAGLSAPPDLDVQQLMTLLAGLLGFGGMRSFEKPKGVTTR
jgi:hypothetical protein